MIVLHSLLPHQHHDELSFDEHEIQHKEADSLLDYIKLVFHEDMGEGHLEHFVVGQFSSLDIDSHFLFSSDYSLELQTAPYISRDVSLLLSDHFGYKDHFPSRLTDEALPLRGPPALI